MIAYLIWHLAGSSVLALVLNFLIELVILAIVFYLVVWVLGVIGIPVPQKVIQLLGVLVLLILILSLFAGCSTLNSPADKAALKDAASVIGQATVNNVLAGVKSDLANGNKVDTASLASAAVFGLFSGVTQAVGNGDASTIIKSFSKGALPNTAQAASVVPVTNPALAAVATVISTAIGAPPAQ